MHRRLTTRVLRITLALAVVALVVAAAAAAAPSGRHTTKTPDVAFVYATSDQNAMQEMALGAQAAADQFKGVSYKSAAPSHIDGPAEVNMFESMTHTSANGIAVMTLTPDLFVRPLHDAAAAGIPLIAVDSKPPAGSNVDLYVGNSNVGLGKMLAAYIIEKIPKNASGEIVIGDDIPGLPVLDNRDKGMIQEIKAERPKITIVGPLNSQSEPSTNYNAWNAIVKAHPDALAYLGPGDQDAVSLAQIERHTGKKYLVGAADLDPNALRAVQQGYVTALASPEHWLKGYIAERLLIQHAETGKPLPKGWWNPGALLVTKANITQILARQRTNATRTAWFMPEVAKEFAHPKKYLKPLSKAD